MSTKAASIDGSTFCTLPRNTLPIIESDPVWETKCSTRMPSSSSATWARSPRCRTAITRSTDSRRARNSASVRICGRRREESRESRRRCRLASSRVDPRTPCTSLDGPVPADPAGALACDSRGSRTCTTVLSGSSSRGVSSPVVRRRRRRRRRLPAALPEPVSASASASDRSSESPSDSVVLGRFGHLVVGGCRSPARSAGSLAVASAVGLVRLAVTAIVGVRHPATAAATAPAPPAARGRVVVGVVGHRSGRIRHRRHRPARRVGLGGIVAGGEHRCLAASSVDGWATAAASTSSCGAVASAAADSTGASWAGLRPPDLPRRRRDPPDRAGAASAPSSG